MYVLFNACAKQFTRTRIVCCAYVLTCKNARGVLVHNGVKISSSYSYSGLVVIPLGEALSHSLSLSLSPGFITRYKRRGCPKEYSREKKARKV